MITGRCLERLGIKAGDTRDAYGRETFLPLSIEELMFPSRNSGSNTDWYWKSLWSTQQPVFHCYNERQPDYVRCN